MKTALHTVSYAGIWPGQALLTVEQIIDRAANLGYDAIMLMAKRPHASLLDLNDERRKILRAKLADAGLQLSIVAGYNDFCLGSEAPDVPLGEMQILYITELARLARDLDCSLVRVFTGFERAQLSYDQQWVGVTRSLKEAARRAADFGVTLCVQNHHDMAVGYQSLADLLAEIDEPNCRAAFDAWAPALHGADLAAGVAALGPRIAYTTVADYVRRPRYYYRPRLVNYEQQTDVIRAVPMGEGFIDYRGFFQALQASGYNGYVAYEMCSMLRGGGGEENLDRCAGRFLTWFDEHGFRTKG
jgi:sugar phosphate isomerase/epimerase